MKQIENRLQVQPAGGVRASAGASTVPEWLMPLHVQRQAGKVPARRWVVLSVGVPLSRRVPWLAVPPGYWPRRTDNFGALAGLDTEIVIDDAAPGGIVHGLATRVLAARPRRLLVQTFGRLPALVILQGGAHDGA
ncbi:hypothetical protein K6V90_26090 [Cupriavidus pauculus]|uniref:hypothetical protein n=1 Tax=Cupriavidus pauculus TaxID=82633 RepID=UPI001C9325D8|nr:hypothetical protein [Cupriavidus pauculus]MBY4734015.1 hypothetical protein [Cupriavidus pauculus]